MAVWILLVVVAQFLNAIVAVVDKYVVSSATIPRPSAYAFYISILSAFSAVIFLFSGVSLPFKLSIPSFENVASPDFFVFTVSLASGAVLFAALTSLFSAFQRADASDVVPVVGACSAIGALLLSFFLLDVNLTKNFFFGFVLLVIGTFVLSLFRFPKGTLLLASTSGLFFAAHFVFLKFLFNITHFDNAFFWSRVGIVLVALALLLFPSFRKQLKIKSASARRRAGTMVILNKVLAGTASLMILKAIELGDVSIVQALGGLQFAYLLGFTALFGQALPQVCGEKCSNHQLVQKTIAVGIIIAGFVVLFL